MLQRKLTDNEYGILMGYAGRSELYTSDSNTDFRDAIIDYNTNLLTHNNGEIYCKGLSAKIEEGSIITNAARTWTRIVSKCNRNIKLSSKQASVVFEVVTKYPRTGIDIPFTISNDPVTIIVDNDWACKPVFNSHFVSTIKTRGIHIDTKSENEKRAIETLREVISEAEFRKYLRYGFILVKGLSDTYQVFRNTSHIKVWRNGKVIEEICIRIKNNDIPLTDNVIAFKTMIETDEDYFKKCGNVYRKVV